MPSCSEAGVLGILPGLIGLIQATEAIKIITGIGDPLDGRLLVFNALKMKFRELKLCKDSDTKIVKGLASSPNDNSKVEDEVRKEVVDLCSNFPIYKNLR